MLGRPSEKNLYLFNGDIVDKGSRSLECILLLFTYKLVYPYYVYLNRGNHESITLNIKNGFRDEITKKYGGEHQFDDQFILEYFGDIFRWMPIAHLINHRIYVVHGGISGSATLAVEDIRNKQLRSLSSNNFMNIHNQDTVQRKTPQPFSPTC